MYSDSYLNVCLFLLVLKRRSHSHWSTPVCLKGFPFQARKLITAQGFLILGIVPYAFLGHTSKSIRAFKSLPEVSLAIHFLGECIVLKIHVFRRQSCITQCIHSTINRSNLLHIFFTFVWMVRDLFIASRDTVSLTVVGATSSPEFKHITSSLVPVVLESDSGTYGGNRRPASCGPHLAGCFSCEPLLLPAI